MAEKRSSLKYWMRGDVSLDAGITSTVDAVFWGFKLSFYISLLCAALRNGIRPEMANITSTSRIYTSDVAQALLQSGPSLMQLASSAWRSQWRDYPIFHTGIPRIFSQTHYRQPP